MKRKIVWTLLIIHIDVLIISADITENMCSCKIVFFKNTLDVSNDSFSGKMHRHIKNISRNSKKVSPGQRSYEYE